jgi:hypothetical protein
MSLRRCEFIAVLGSAVTAWPLAARAQQSAPVIGYVSPVARDLFSIGFRPFLQGLDPLRTQTPSLTKPKFRSTAGYLPTHRGARVSVEPRRGPCSASGGASSSRFSAA